MYTWSFGEPPSSKSQHHRCPRWLDHTVVVEIFDHLCSPSVWLQPLVDQRLVDQPPVDQPLTNQPLPHKLLVPNIALKQAIDEMLERV